VLARIRMVARLIRIRTYDSVASTASKLLNDRNDTVWCTEIWRMQHVGNCMFNYTDTFLCRLM